MNSEKVNSQLDSQQEDWQNINSNRCNNNTPFMIYGSGLPYTLNYNLPDSSSFTVKGYIPITLLETDFIATPELPIVYNPWQTWVAENNSTALHNAIANLIAQTTNAAGFMAAFNEGKFFVNTPVNFASSNPVINPENIGIIIQALQEYIYSYNFGSGTPLGNNAITTQNVIDQDITLGRISAYKNKLSDFLQLFNEAISNINNNLIPSVVTNANGITNLQYTNVQLPTTAGTNGARPQLYIVLTYKVTNYLGNYGAGKTLKTLSLLPGEKTNISLKTYKSTETVDSRVDNVLDSFTSKSLDSLEKLLEQENSTNKTKGGGFGLSLSLPLAKGLGSLGFGGGFKSQTTNMSKTINRALTKHVDESQNLRNVEVKTETKTTNKEGEETAIIREIANINKSRVLNFVFRQLNQEYTSVTYVEDAGLMFTNGNIKDEATCTLGEMDSFLETYIINDHGERTLIKDRIIAMLCSFVDHVGSEMRFIEKITHTLKDINGNDYVEGGDVVVNEYYAKRNDLFTDVQINDTTNVQVPGIVMQVQKHILNTDSVIVDALLGQGEALDCYNIQLQQLNVLKEKLNHTEQLQKVEQISAVVNNADEYSKVYNHQIDEQLLQAIAK